MPTLEEIRSLFTGDRFATECAVAVIDAAEPGRSVCSMVLQPRHRNAAGTPQGGALFTLGDFAFAVAANGFSEHMIISLQHDITYFTPAHGTVVRAEAACVRAGRTTCFYTVDYFDELDNHLARMTVNGFVTKQKNPLNSAEPG